MPVRKVILLLSCIVLMLSCSVKKFIPEGEYLLDDVKIISTTHPAHESKAKSYVRQSPNSKWFSLFKVPMYTYSLSGTDTAKWVNKALRRVGEPPVIYDPLLAERTRSNIEKMLHNDGYLHATVDNDTVRNEKSRRLVTEYYLHERERYYVSDISLLSEDSIVKSIVEADSASSLLYPGMPFSIDVLETERRRIAAMLNDIGYYRFQKEHVTFTADTLHHSNKVGLTMNIELYMPTADSEPIPHKVYHIDNIYFVADNGLKLDKESLAECDTMKCQDFSIYFKEDPVVLPKVLAGNLFIKAGEKYSRSNVEKTHNSFVQLSPFKYTTVRMVENPDTALLDCCIMYERNKRRSVGFQLDGTNTAGDLGAAASLTFSDKNTFKCGEVLSLRLFGAFETTDYLKGYDDKYFLEYGAEASLRFHGGLVSRFVPVEKRKLISSTQFSVKYNIQKRPEFNRRILSGSWSYKWSKRPDITHKLDVLDLNYLYVPSISEKFKSEYLDSISDRNSIIKYNYENQLITKFGYTLSYNSSLDDSKRLDRTVVSAKAGIEFSGNMLYLFNLSCNSSKNADGQYTVANIAYAQYFKIDADCTSRTKFDDKNSLVVHVGLGFACPYGNSWILPFDKRYFAGGANGLRGWTVRTLGPGSYRGAGSKVDFISQTGDIKLDLSLEYRTHLFGNVHSAVFVDAGNIWTYRPYDEQPGGCFTEKFLEELAFSYGLGLRLELDMFVFRLDAAMKAVNPAMRGKDKYPLVRPDFGRDFAIHFAIGYPF